MLYEQPLFFFDVTAVTMMLVLAYLSKRLGAALQIKPHYTIFFITSAVIVMVSGIETIPYELSLRSVSVATNAMRFAASAVALAVALRYWSWLFIEFSKK